MVKVGINGAGRIGRAILRVNSLKNYFEVVAINDINPDIENIAYTLNYDTLYGRLHSPFRNDNGSLINDKGERIKVFHEKLISDVDWDKCGVDYIIDASGVKDNVKLARDVIENRNAKRVF